MKKEFVVTTGDITHVFDKKTGRELAVIEVGVLSGDQELPPKEDLLVEADLENTYEVNVLSFILSKPSDGTRPYLFKVRINEVDEMTWGKEKTARAMNLVDGNSLSVIDHIKTIWRKIFKGEI